MERLGRHLTRLKLVSTRERLDAILDRHLIAELETARYVANATNVLLLGPPGVGKTHLAIALARKAIEQGDSARFLHATDLVHQLNVAAEQGALDEALRVFARPHVLVVDELGYLPMERRAGHLLFQLVRRRYEKGSLMVTSNQPIGSWGDMLGDDVVATAILDRLLLHGHIVTIKGESYCLREKRRAGVVPTTEMAL